MRQALFLIFLISTFSIVNGQEHTIAYADATYDQFNLKESHNLLEIILTIDTIPHDQKCKALRRLAHQDWKYFQNYALAKERLLKTDSIGIAKSYCHITRKAEISFQHEILSRNEI